MVDDSSTKDVSCPQVMETGRVQGQLQDDWTRSSRGFGPAHPLPPFPSIDQVIATIAAVMSNSKWKEREWEFQLKRQQ